MDTYSSIFDTYDIIAMEAFASIAEYAMDSAQFEIDNGRDEFIPIYEAAEANANNSNTTLFSKLKKKVVTFCKEAISKIKMALNSIANRMRLKKSIKMDNKLASIDKDKAIHPSSVDWCIINNANLPNTVKLNGISPGIPGLFAEFKNNIQKIMSDPKFSKQLNLTKLQAQMIAVPDFLIKKSATKVGDFTFSVSQVRMYLNDCIKYLQTLMDMIPLAESTISQARNEGIDVNAGRSAITKMISFMTSYVNAYYKALMRVSKSLVTGKEMGVGEISINDLRK